MIRNRLIFGLVVMISVGALMLGGCGDGNGGGGDEDQAKGSGEVIGTTATPGEDLVEIAERLNAVLTVGNNTIGATAVFENLADGDTGNDWFVVDIRDSAAFDAGHIPGALNIPLQELPMALLNGTWVPPNDRNIVVASDYGNDGNFANVIINVVILDLVDPGSHPYSSKTLAHGMNAWSFRSETRSRFDDDLGVRRVNEAGDTNIETPVDQGAFPDFAPFDSGIDSVTEKILVRAHNYLNSFSDQDDVNTNAVDLLANLEDGDPSNDPQILDVRNTATYNAGHVPGAILIPWKEVADLNKTMWLDPTRPIVVYCVTGHTGAISTATLGILGYDVVNMLYGYNGWVPTSMRNFNANLGWDFPLDDDSEDDLTSLANYEPPGGCMECHTSLTAIYYDRWQDPPAGAVAPPSSGEG